MTDITIRRMLDAGLVPHGTPIDLVLATPDGRDGEHAGTVPVEDMPYAPDWILDAPLILIDARDRGRLRLAIGIAPPVRRRAHAGEETPCNPA
ncbi:hypothetical protein Uis1B_2174 [Bifidobacterium margollesii]|uniref:Uncharacterized protein n=1 Tax=Bifidobacterium margollesii TaxID=2020964 RepID=A0A2N5J700_9BIFI|nr:hypothetical protein [Bifidobacterium margollesii]PLS29992.1 hypothetical protein Uis1B_2174 [Bifidobacterium margollesii]